MTQRIDGIEITVKNFNHGEPFSDVIVFRGCSTENDMTFRMYIDPTPASLNRAYNVALRIAGKQAMTDEHINHLIAARNAITDRTDEYINRRAVDHIDTVLRDVPPGQRADVDALLGRICSAFDVAEREGAQMKRMAADAMRDQEPIEY